MLLLNKVVTLKLHTLFFLHYVVHIWMPGFSSSSALYLCTSSALASPHLLLLGDWSGNILPTTKQSKFNLLTVKRLFFRNHTTWPQPLSSWLFSSFTLSVTPNMINWLSMCLLHFLLLTAFFLSSYLLQSPYFASSVPSSLVPSVNKSNRIGFLIHSPVVKMMCENLQLQIAHQTELKSLHGNITQRWLTFYTFLFRQG